MSVRKFAGRQFCRLPDGIVWNQQFRGEINDDVENIDHVISGKLTILRATVPADTKFCYIVKFQTEEPQPTTQGE